MQNKAPLSHICSIHIYVFPTLPQIQMALYADDIVVYVVSIYS